MKKSLMKSVPKGIVPAPNMKSHEYFFAGISLGI
jgi:hypothetical protein